MCNIWLSHVAAYLRFVFLTRFWRSVRFIGLWTRVPHKNNHYNFISNRLSLHEFRTVDQPTLMTSQHQVSLWKIIYMIFPRCKISEQIKVLMNIAWIYIIICFSQTIIIVYESFGYRMKIIICFSYDYHMWPIWMSTYQSV